ncbi:MAG: alpha/beta hydrolase fold domain-containing protein [Solirubrobacteraceae bacterium]
MTATSAIEVRRDLTYATADGAPLKLDLYLPARAAGTCPVVLYLHGGGFMVGARTDYAQERLEPVARGGLAIASAQYRFSDVATYPAQIHDTKAAVRWLRANASEHGFSAERVGVWGASAGGYLALMLGVTSGSSEHEGELGDHVDRSSAVDAVAAWFAPTNLLTVEARRPPADLEPPPFISGPLPEPSMAARMLGVESLAAHPQLAAAASPVTHAAGTHGPFLLMHGDRDWLTSERQSSDMHEALLAAGADSTLLLIAGANHEDPAFHGPAALGAVSGFFRAALTETGR